jgi:hypothetical protein
MVRLVIALVFVLSCGGAGKPVPTAASGDGAPIVAKRIAVSWGIEKQGPDPAMMADIFLATTDETGKQVSHPLGRYKGACTVIAPAKEMNAISGVACRTGGTGTELHAVVEHGEDIVVLKLGIDEGVTPDPMARAEVARVKVPPGAKIEPGS